MRLAVPHTAAKTWSYSRLGEQATDTVTSSSGATFTENQDTCGALSINAYSPTGLAGSFEYTDANRTQITQGTWEQVVQGKGRLAVYAGASSPNYELLVTNTDAPSAHQTFGGESFTYGYGTSLSVFGGIYAQQYVGSYIQSNLGGTLNVTVGMSTTITAGYAANLVFADSYEFRRGEQLEARRRLGSAREQQDPVQRPPRRRRLQQGDGRRRRRLRDRRRADGRLDGDGRLPQQRRELGRREVPRERLTRRAAS